MIVENLISSKFFLDSGISSSFKRGLNNPNLIKSRNLISRNSAVPQI